MSMMLLDVAELVVKLHANDANLLLDVAKLLVVVVKLQAYNCCGSNSYERSSALHCHIARFTAGEEKSDGGGGLVRAAKVMMQRGPTSAGGHGLNDRNPSRRKDEGAPNNGCTRTWAARRRWNLWSSPKGQT
jgi:hypothetical protein